MEPTLPEKCCGVCLQHNDSASQERFEIRRNRLWVLRHHPNPAPRVGWLLLDAYRHVSGPVDFNAREASTWGLAVQQASRLIQTMTGCDRVYAIAFGEGARHLHLHLIPRFGDDPETEAWCVADLYRQVAQKQHPPANPEAIQAFVTKGREVVKTLGEAL